MVRKEGVQSRGSLFLVLLQFTLAKTCPGLRRRSLNSSELKEAAGCLRCHAASAAGGLLQAQPGRGSAGGRARWGHVREATRSYRCRPAAWRGDTCTDHPCAARPIAGSAVGAGTLPGQCHAGAMSLAWRSPLWRSGSHCLCTTTTESCLAGSCVSVLDHLEVKLVPTHFCGRRRKSMGNAVSWSSPKLCAWEGTFPHC